jgi:ribosomal protein L21E
MLKGNTDVSVFNYIKVFKTGYHVTIVINISIHFHSSEQPRH